MKTHKGKDIPCLWIGIINIVKMSNIQRHSMQSMQFVTVPMTFFTEVETAILKGFKEAVKIPNSKNNPEHAE